MERYIFPGGELLHVSKVLEATSESGLEAVDVESLRPHYAKTLWAWSDGLEANIAAARSVTSETVVRAYRLYLAGSASAFERAWISLHQMLCAAAHGRSGVGADARRTIGVSLQPRLHVPVGPRPGRHIAMHYVFRSRSRCRPDHDGPASATGCCASSAASPRRAGSSRRRRCRRRSRRSRRRSRPTGASTSATTRRRRTRRSRASAWRSAPGRCSR